MARTSADGQRWLIPTIVLFVALPVALALWNAFGPSDGDGAPKLSREGSTSLGLQPAPLPITDEPTTYAITYELERYTPDTIQRSTDRIEVRRPFDSRIESFRDGRLISTRTSRFGSLVISTGAGPRSLVTPPAPASGDLRLADVLRDAVADGHLLVRERRRVLGQTCQVYRSGTSVSAGALVPAGSKGDEYADFCVDATGLVLEEVWMKDGRPLQRRIATSRHLEVALTDDRFALAGEQPVPYEDGNGFLRSLVPTSGFEGTIYRLTHPLEGFAYQGRALVQPPRLNPFQDPVEAQERSREQVSIVDVWERGPDLLVFSQTIAADISAVPNDDQTAEVLDLGDIGVAATVLDLRSNEVRIELPEARFLRIAGTLPRATLIEIANSLRAEEGTGLQFLDEVPADGSD